MEPGGDAGERPSSRYPEPDGEGFDLSDPARSFARTVRVVLVEPAGFFGRLAPRGGMLNPLLFAVICVLIPLPFSLLVAPLDPLSGGGPDVYALFDALNGPGDARGTALAVGILVAVALVLAPLAAVLGLYIGAAIYHLLVLLFVRPAHTDFEATFRVVAYTSATTLLTWLPAVGLLATLYGFYLTFVGIRQMHGTTTVRALAVALVPAVPSTAVVLLALFSPPPSA